MSRAVENANCAIGNALAERHDAKIDVTRARLNRIFAKHTACAIVFKERCRVRLRGSNFGEYATDP